MRMVPGVYDEKHGLAVISLTSTWLGGAFREFKKLPDHKKSRNSVGDGLEGDPNGSVGAFFAEEIRKVARREAHHVERLLPVGCGSEVLKGSRTGVEALCNSGGHSGCESRNPVIHNP